MLEQRPVPAHAAECHRRESREACRPHRGCTLGDHTITGRSKWRVLSLSRRLLLSVGPESQPRRNNSEHGNQKQRRDRASHGTPPSTQRMDGTIEGAARHGHVRPHLLRWLRRSQHPVTVRPSHLGIGTYCSRCASRSSASLASRAYHSARSRMMRLECGSASRPVARGVSPVPLRE
jgi:hypothetical protein